MPANACELQALKALSKGGVPQRTARAALVDVRWLTEMFPAVPGLDLLTARLLFTGPVPLPNSLPAEPADSDDEDALDDGADTEGAWSQTTRQTPRQTPRRQNIK